MSLVKLKKNVMEIYRILVINPGSTSTKIAVYENEKSIFLKNIKHSTENLASFASISDQYSFRKDVILNELKDVDIDTSSLNAIIGRGGLVKPIESGVYEVNDALIRDLKKGVMGEHASNLGGLIADDLAKTIPGARAFIADPVVVDELDDVARITGSPDMPRQSVFHALNQKAVARNFARTRGFIYEDLNLIVAHMGGGISIGAHRKGRVVDVNNAIDGYGPFSPERAGTLPTGALIRACFSGKYTFEDMKKLVNGNGGLVAHLGTNEAYEAKMRALAGDKKAELVLDAMAYQVGKAIGGCAAVLKGKVNGIILTGGIANNEMVVDYIKEMVDFLAPVAVYPGEDEMTALMQNALGVLNNKLECKVYQ